MEIDHVLWSVADSSVFSPTGLKQILLATIRNRVPFVGLSPSFVPSPGNRIASPLQTWYDDVGVLPFWYRLTAVDIHGNESPSALLLPAGTVDVAENLPREVALALTSPNPARQSVGLRMDLPVETTVDVAVYDASGRRVWDLAKGAFAAGRWPLLWRGETRSGSRSPAGVYFVQLRIEKRTWSQRVIQLR